MKQFASAEESAASSIWFTVVEPDMCTSVDVSPHSLHNPEGGGGLPARLWCPSLLGNLMDPKKNKTKQQQSCTSECSL